MSRAYWPLLLVTGALWLVGYVQFQHARRVGRYAQAIGEAAVEAAQAGDVPRALDLMAASKAVFDDAVEGYALSRRLVWASIAIAAVAFVLSFL